MTPERLAQLFHETYERLAPSYGYRTREESAKPWDEVPEQNRALMVATCAEVLATMRRPWARVFLGRGPFDTHHDGRHPAMTNARDIIAATLVATHDADWRAKGLGCGPDITDERVVAAYQRDAQAVIDALRSAGMLAEPGVCALPASPDPKRRCCRMAYQLTSDHEGCEWTGTP